MPHDLREFTVKMLRRTLFASAVTAAAVVGFAGVASAQEVDYPVEVIPNTNSQAAVQGAQVSAAEAAAVAGTLPYTGNDSSLPLAEIGVGMLAAGGLMVVAVRRRQLAHND